MKKLVAADATSLAVWLASLAILGVSAIPITQPGYMDAYYYQHVATNLATGRGLVEDYVWNYLPPPETLTHPSNLYWMPLTSLALAPFFQLLGDSFRVAQMPFILFASLFVLFTFRLAIWLTGNRRHALAASALTLFSGFYFAYWTSPDSFALFGLAANIALVAGFKAAGMSRKSIGLAAGAGALAALSHMARADGALVLGAILSAIAFQAWRGSEAAGVRPRRERVIGGALAIGACLAAYIIVMSPWFMRSWQLVGSFLPAAGLKTLFLREYNDFFTFGRDLTWQSYASWGLLPALRSKVEALGTNIMVLFGMEYHLVPFALLGLWHFRRKAALVPFFIYAAMLYFTMSLLFTFPSGRGSMLHSSVVFLPWLSVAVVAGLDQSVVWAGQRLRHWKVGLAQRNLTLVLVLFAIFFSGFLLIREAGKRDERYRHYGEIAAWLREAAPDSVIMIADPPGYYYSSGKGSIVIPSDEVDSVLLAARCYGASYLVLEKVHSRPLHSIYSGERTDPQLRKVAEIETTKIYRIGEQ
ncbi:MAG: hypothetical protein HYX94_09745 [Chloroflexi bacterium]|nr:hypothetical protein [Chloroflexota bacterium]